MQRLLAWMMSFALLNVISACPMLAHQVPVAQSCCEHSKGRDLPCTDTTPNNCPYILLEKSLGKLGLWAVLTGVVSGERVELNRPMGWFSSPTWSERQVDRSGSYLRFGVLLI